ncbi:hypothetical protein [Streptomyces sp. NPDC058579]|uniref:hypothetical protein n=1 Tax=Streptomyces sp. NPDC058579 TaxID=3346548 RepID=UPI003649CA01
MSSTNEQNPAPANEQGSHHYVLTLDLPGRASGTWTGTLTPGTANTRHDLYRQLREQISASQPEFDRANVGFFSLEPNRL